MNTDDIIKLAREAAAKHGQELDESPEPEIVAFLVEFHTLVTQAERESRLVAQTENEQLKARLARSGVELRKAVRDEREACANICEVHALGWKLNPGRNPEAGYVASSNCAYHIRARNHVVDANKMDCTDCECADNDPCKRTAPGLALESGEFVPAEKIVDWAAA